MRRWFALALLGLLRLSAAASDYYLTGSTAAYDGSSAGIFASYWGAANTEDLMSDNGDGTYSRTYKNVPVGVYAFQVIMDGDWSSVIKDGANNYFIDVVEPCDVEVVLEHKYNTQGIAKASGRAKWRKKTGVFFEPVGYTPLHQFKHIYEKS